MWLLVQSIIGMLLAGESSSSLLLLYSEGMQCPVTMAGQPLVEPFQPFPSSRVTGRCPTSPLPSLTCSSQSIRDCEGAGTALPVHPLQPEDPV